MSNINDFIEQAKNIDDPAKIVEVFKACGLDISEAEAKAFVDTQELPDSVMDAIAGGGIYIGTDFSDLRLINITKTEPKECEIHFGGSLNIGVLSDGK